MTLRRILGPLRVKRIWTYIHIYIVTEYQKWNYSVFADVHAKVPLVCQELFQEFIILSISVSTVVPEFGGCFLLSTLLVALNKATVLQAVDGSTQRFSPTFLYNLPWISTWYTMRHLRSLEYGTVRLGSQDIVHVFTVQLSHLIKRVCLSPLNCPLKISSFCSNSPSACTTTRCSITVEWESLVLYPTKP